MRHRSKGFTLTEIMLVVALISFLIAIVVPTFFRARELSRMRSCQENQYKIDGAKEQWALENRMSATDTPTWEVLIGNTRYIRKSPACPATGTYTLNMVSMHPTCSLSDQPLYPHTFVATPPGT